jgi:hypothetical protein
MVLIVIATLCIATGADRTAAGGDPDTLVSIRAVPLL